MIGSTGENRRSGRRFILQRRIGAGAFGEVYLAEQDSGAGFTRPVAIKLLNPDVAGSREAARRMRDEARILGRLSHRNIVSVLDLVDFGDRWGVVMDYVPGADLEQVLHALELTGQRFPAPAALEVGAAVFRALHAAYHADDGRGGTLKVVHRDIKPSNVRITDDGEVKVLDFGVARVDLDTREAATKAQGWIGTERYMAPERILMEGDTPAGDVYAAAASMMELLRMRPLGRTPVLPDRHAAFLDEAFADLEGLDGPGADEVVAFLRAALDADPSARPTARDASVRCAELARRVDGESLAQFAMRFVGTIPEVLGYTSEPAEGVLSEYQTPREPLVGGGASGGSAEPTMYVDADVGAPPARRVRRPLWILLAFIGIAGVGAGLVAAGAGAIYLTRGEEPAPAVVPGTPADPSAAATPVPSPAPTAAPSPRQDTGGAPDVAPASDPAPDPPASRPEPAPPRVTSPPVVVPSTTTVAPQPAPAPPDDAPVPSDAPRIGRALVVMADASSIEVTCGDRSQAGTSSARITDFPAGRCEVRVNYLGSTLSTEVVIDRAVTVTCRAVDGRLSCAPDS